MTSARELYLCINHVAPFQLSMKKLGRITSTPRLVVGEKRYCYVCGAEAGPNPADPFVFRVEIRPAFDEELIQEEWDCLEKLREQGLDMEEAIEVVGALICGNLKADDENGKS